MKNRYDNKTIKNACQLYEKEVPLRTILEKTGIKSTSTILFRCNPEYRADMIERGRKWRKKNPKRWEQIWRKAAKVRAKKQKAIKV